MIHPISENIFEPPKFKLINIQTLPLWSISIDKSKYVFSSEIPNIYNYKNFQPNI